MKKLSVLLLSLILILSLASCQNEKAETPKEEEMPVEEEKDLYYYLQMGLNDMCEVLDVEREELEPLLSEVGVLFSSGQLETSWDEYKDTDGLSKLDHMVFKNIDKENGILDVILFKSAYIQPMSMKDDFYHGLPLRIDAGRENRTPYVPVGEARLKFTVENNERKYISNEYTPIDDPVNTALKNENIRLADKIEKSPLLKDEFPEIDEGMKSALLRNVRRSRYVESFDELTLYDIENMDDFVFDIKTVVVGDDYDFPEEGYSHEVLEKMKNLRNFTSTYLFDEFKFSDEASLGNVYLNIYPSINSTDKVKLSGREILQLNIEGFDKDIEIDLSSMPVGNLIISSPMAGVTAFSGCENVSYLMLKDTTTDTSLISTDNFPNLKALNVNAYSDTKRFRDFSRLKDFGDELFIDVTLKYKAANDDTIKSLKGANVRFLHLRPYDGAYPLQNEPSEEAIKLSGIDESLISFS